MKVNDLVLNKYRILKIISGDGSNKRGMSNLYKAQEKDLGSYWAIKEIIKNTDGTVSIQQSALIKEAQIMKKLSHPSIPRIVSLEQTKDKIIIVMDWVDGKSVDDWIRTSGAMPVQRGLSIIKSVCSVVSYLHNRTTPIFYRDMKPENIMYDPTSKRVMLLDFGISVEVDPSKPIPDLDRMGTRGYYDPLSLGRSKSQIAKNAPVRYFDLRSDIYSLGWTMFSIFSGVHPANYQESKKLKGLEITRDVREFSKNVPESLANVIIKATEPNPDDRYQSVEELQIALEDLDKVDRGIYKKLRRRINTVLGLGVAGFTLSLLSVAPYMAYEQGLKNEYQVLVANASKSGRFEDYVKVIEYSPKELEPYFGLIDTIKQDGVFSVEEEQKFLDLVNPSLSSIESSKRYKEFAFEVGRLYWLYYPEQTSQEIASRWFKDAKGYSDLADVYASIGSFPTDVVKAANEGSDTGMYKSQWDLLKSVEGQSELVALQISRAKLYLITTYPYRLKADGVSKEDTISELGTIASLVSSVNSEEGRQVELAKELEVELENARKVVEEAYNV